MMETECFSSSRMEGVTLHDGVTVYRTAREGLGLHATRFFKKGDVVWREMPGPFLQHRLSVRFAPSCFGCGALLGSLPDIVGWALCDHKAWCARFTASVESGLFEGPEFRLPQPVPCSGCDALFCSKASGTEAGIQRSVAMPSPRGTTECCATT